MRKLAPVLLCALAILTWWLFPRADEKIERPPVPDPEPLPTVAAVHAAKEAAHPKKMTGAFHSRAAGAAPADGLIPFRVEKGVAIAYGDLILGEPDDPQITEGYYEAPAPSLWERPEIPYAIQNDLPEPQRVKTAVEYFNQHTPVQFVPYDGQQADAVVFEVGDDNCYSLLGKQGGLQPIKLARDCDWVAIAHEMMHVLGFVHEQSRPDRDRYLEILWPNIEDKYRDQYAMVPDALMEASRQGAFDYRSIMLYSPKTFAKPGTITMRTRTGEAILPAENGLSAGDIEKLKEMYRPYVK